MEDFNMKSVSALTLIAFMSFLSCGGNGKLPQGSGLIEATEVTISSQAAGELTALFRDEGANVAAGDTLAQIDTIATMIRLRQAQALYDAAQARLENAAINISVTGNNLDLANKEFERVATLLRSGSANQQQYDQTLTAFDQAKLANQQAEVTQKAARADLDNAQSQIELLQKQVHDCFPVSPVSGTVVERFIDTGELVSAGKSLLRIAKLDTVWVKIYLPPNDLTRISLGSHASVDPEDGRATALDGTISWISPEAEFTPKNVQTKEARAGLLYAVKILIPNPEQTLKIGMPVSVVVQ
jgi:HlyD family secretion protein